MNIVVYIFIYYIIGIVIEFALMTIFCRGCIAIDSDITGGFCEPYTIGYEDIICVALVPFPFSVGGVILDCYCCIKYKCTYDYQSNKKRLHLT